MFQDAPYMSAAEKALVLKQWKRFLFKLATCDFSKTTGCDYGTFPAGLEKAFPDRLYKHLSLNFGFIAHYNRYGFLSARFGDPQALAETIDEMEKWQPMGAYVDYKDINAAMVEEIRVRSQY